jgi:hypothetical protein
MTDLCLCALNFENTNNMIECSEYYCFNKYCKKCHKSLECFYCKENENKCLEHRIDIISIETIQKNICCKCIIGLILHTDEFYYCLNCNNIIFSPHANYDFYIMHVNCEHNIIEDYEEILLLLRKRYPILNNY